MGLMEWRKREDLVTGFRQMMDSPVARLAMEVLTNESPSNFQNRSQSAELTLGQIEGYNMCLNNLMAMAELPQGVAEVEATFAEENNEQ